MKLRKILSLLLAALLMSSALVGCAEGKEEDNNTGSGNNEYNAAGDDSDASTDTAGGEITAFRPVDCGIQPRELFEYPFMGMTLKLSDTMLEKLESREVFEFEDEDYTADADGISYAVLRFSATTKEQRAEEVMSVDILSWEEALAKIGAIGVYKKDMTDKLDELTDCDKHELIGESADGEYAYYLSTNSNADEELLSEFNKSVVTITEMHEIDLSLGYTAISEDRIDGLENVGEFTAEDVFGNTYTQDIFKDYDLTLVNAFTTWCTYCVDEMPDLEKLREEYAQKGIKLGVLGVVLDSKTQSGIDEGAIELAQTLHKRSGAGFPFLIPDETEMNGRLTGIASFPETFFVDKDGNIVSEPYFGARSQSEWAKIVDEEFAKLNGDNQ